MGAVFKYFQTLLTIVQGSPVGRYQLIESQNTGSQKGVERVILAWFDKNVPGLKIGLQLALHSVLIRRIPRSPSLDLVELPQM
jgi:hypothetical protein